MLWSVTTTATPQVTEEPMSPPRPAQVWRDRLAHGSVAAVLLWWGLVMTYHSGGRDRWVLTLGIPIALLALAAARPWAVLSTRFLAGATATAAAAVAICLIDPTHWYAGSQAASYAYAAVLLVAVCSYASTPGRRTLILALLLGVGVAQFAWAFAAWQHLGSPTSAMLGRFFWYNQFAAFELAPAVIGVGLAVSGAVPLRLLAGVAAVLGSVGVVLSTSRASMTLLGLGWLLAGAVALVGATTGVARARVAGRWVALAALTAGVLLAVTGPPFFDHRASVLGATASRSVGQPVGQNGVYRLDFWRQSLHLIREHVLTGTGFGSFGRQTRLLDPTAPHANFVHNGFLQAISDGGLLLGVPFLLACAGAGFMLLRRISRTACRQEYGVVPLCVVAVLLLAAHSGVDFDWSYPSSFAEVAIVAGLALAWSPTGRTALGSLRARQVLCVVLAACSVVLAVHAVPGGWLNHAPRDPSVPVTQVAR